MTIPRESNHLRINTNDKRGIINRHVYGHFAEHLGRCIYGGFFVGEQSDIPNENGIRKDVIEALSNLNVPNLRWPGGCFADTYHWKDGIGSKTNRPAIVNRWWGNVTEDNSFGTHDFLNLCEFINAEPYITANLGSGTVQELMDWVQYANFDGVSPMSNLRRRNGRKDPWSVRFWGLGNEAWGCGGNMTANYYANLYSQFATFMTGWSNTENIFRIASGPNTDDYRWTETLMQNIPRGLLEGISLHYYAVTDWQNKGSATAFSEVQYYNTMVAALRMNELISKHSAVMDVFDPLKRIALVVDEWGTWYDVEPGTNPGFLHQQNTMRDALVAAITLNIFNNHCERVRMANLAQTVNVLQAIIFTREDKMWFTPTYYVMEMYKPHQNATLLLADLDAQIIRSGDVSLPCISVSASIDSFDKIAITVANLHATETQSLTISISGKKVCSASLKTLVSNKIHDHNTFEDPFNVKLSDPQKIDIDHNTFSVKLSPFSVSAIALE